MIKHMNCLVILIMSFGLFYNELPESCFAADINNSLNYTAGDVNGNKNYSDVLIYTTPSFLQVESSEIDGEYIRIASESITAIENKSEPKNKLDSDNDFLLDIKLTANEKKWLQGNKFFRVPILNTEPYYYYKAGVPAGISVEILNLIAKSIGIDIEYVSCNSCAKCYSGVMYDKEFDLILMSNKTKEREKFLAFSRYYIKNQSVIITNNNSREVYDLIDLNGKTISLENGTAFQEYMLREHPEIKQKLVDSTLEALECVSTNQVDAYFGKKITALQQIGKVKLNNLRVFSPDNLDIDKYAFAVRKEFEPLIGIINKGLTEITEAVIRDIYKGDIRENIIEQDYDMSKVYVVSLVIAILLLAVGLWNRTLHYKVRNHTNQIRKELELKKKAEEALKKIGEELEEEVRKRTLELKAEKERFKLLFEHSPGAYCIVDGLKIVECNTAAVSLFGYSSKEEFLTLTPVSNAPEFQPNGMRSSDYIGKKIEEANINGFGSFECLYLKKDGSEIYCEINFASIAMEGERTLLFVIHDLSERKEFEDELKSAKEIAESASLAKTVFLANMSHEIRTPMNAVIGMADLLAMTSLTQRQNSYLCSIQSASRLLLGIINNILDFSKIDANSMDLEQVEFNLLELLMSIRDMHIARAEEKQLDLIFDCAETETLNLIGDSLRLSQVLNNLISNAIKFTNNGIVKVSIKPEYQTEDSVTLKFEVVDDGIGLNDEQIKNLFKSFSQADASTTRKYGGTGLGLAISEKIVNLMGGHIDVSSEAGNGSCFKFTCKFKTSFAEETLDITFAKGYKIAVVSDSDAISSIFNCELLPLVGSLKNVARISDFDAVGETNIKTYDIVFVDTAQYSTANVEVLENDISKGEGTILVFLTSQKLLGYLLKHNVVSLVRSFFYRELLKAIITCHDRNNLLQCKQMPTSEISSHLTLNNREAKILLVEDNKTNQLIAKELLRVMGASVTVADNGLDAVRILNSQDFDVVLMDIQMPIMDGYTATRKIRLKYSAEELPILAMTANVFQNDIEKVREVGMQDHISKPIDPKGLCDTLNKWLQNNIEDVEVMKPPKQGSAYIADGLYNISGLDVKLGLANVAFNEQSYVRILKFFVNRQRDIISRIKDSLRSGENEEAIRLVHTLKGTGGSLGLVDISSKAAEWERLLRDGASWYKLDHSLIDDYNMVCNEIISVTKNWVMEHEKGSGIILSDEEFGKKLSELCIALKGSDTVSREIIAELLKSSRNKYTWLEDVELCISHFDFSEAIKIIAENT